MSEEFSLEVLTQALEEMDMTDAELMNLAIWCMVKVMKRAKYEN